MSGQIYKHDNQPAADLELNLRGSPILARPRGQAAGEKLHMQSVATTRSAQSRPPTLPERGLHRDISEVGAIAPPQVALQLPDLHVAAESMLADRVFDIQNLVSWVGIGLGAVIAVALIWSSPKNESPPIDEAPTWEAPRANGPRESSLPSSAPAIEDGSAPSTSNRSGSVPREEGSNGVDMTPNATNNLSWPGQDNVGAPALDEARGRQQPARGSVAAEPAHTPPVRTARGDSNWNNAGPRPPASEAPPVGRIMNVAVPQ